MKQLLPLFLLLYACSPHKAIDPTAPIKNSITYFQKGKLDESSGFPIITVRGTPYQAGLQYGVLLRPRIQQLYQQIEHEIAKKNGNSFFKKLIANIYFWWKIRKIRKKIGSDLRNELRGIHDGSKLSQFEIDTIAFFPQIFFDISCSSVAIKKADQLIHARNLDWSNIGFLADFALITRYEITGKIPYLNFSYIGYPGLYSGINKEGLSLAINMNGSTPDHDHYNSDLPIPYKTRQILATSKNLDDVAQNLKNYHSHAWFLSVVSKNDSSAKVFELVRGQLLTSQMKNNILAITNLSLSEKSKKEFTPISQHSNSNYARDQRILEILQQSQSKAPLQQAFDVLSDIKWHHLPHTPFLTHTLNSQRTVQSFIFDNINLDIHFSFAKHHAAGQKFRRYSFTKDKITPSQEALTFFKSEKYQQTILCYAQKNNCPNTPAYYFSRNEFQKALLASQKLLKKFPSFPPLYYQQADILVKLDHKKQAFQLLYQLLQKDNLAPYPRYKALIRLSQIAPTLAQKKDFLRRAKELASQYYLDKKIKKQLQEAI